MRNIILFMVLLIACNGAMAEKYMGVDGPGIQLTAALRVDMGAENIVHWAGLNASWWLNSNGAGDGLTFAQTQSAVQTAFASWQSVSTSDIGFAYSGSTSSSWSYDGSNVVYWAESGDPIFDQMTGFLAVTLISINASEELLDVDIVFNGRDYTWRTNGSDYDVEAVSAHEIGHMIGLHHTEVQSAPLPTMYAYYQGTAARSLEWDDQVGASFLYRGNLIDNETFSGLDYYNWSLTVTSGKTLTIQPGTTLRFKVVVPSLKLTVNGTLSAVGTSGSSILFTSNSTTPQKGDWYGIVLKGPTNVLKYCTVNYSTYGFFINNTSINTLENCTAHNSKNYGITGYNTSQDYHANQVKNCTVGDDNNSGIMVQNGRLDLYNTGVWNNPGWGVVHWNGGKSYMEGTMIWSNTKDGVWVNGTTAYARLTPDDEMTPGNNSVVGNDATGSYNQIYVIAGGAFLGDTYQGQPKGGYNEISGPCYWIRNRTSNMIMAHWCYWGNCPDPDPNCFYGPVDASNCLLILGKTATGNTSSHSNALPSAWHSAEDAFNLIAFYKDKVLRAGAAEARDAIHQLSSLVGPGAEHVNELGMLWEDYLGSVALSPVPREVRSLALAYLVQVRMSKMDFDGAIKVASAILEGNTDDELWFHCQSEIVSALAAKGDIAAAEAAYERMYVRGMEINPSATEHLIEVINFARVDRNMPIADRMIRQITSAVVPSSYGLHQNHPNPFNPVTTIEYEIATSEHVTLRIYDVLGREVATLIDGHEEAGFKSVQFDATYLPTGVYFYRLTAGKFTDVKKMVLVR